VLPYNLSKARLFGSLTGADQCTAYLTDQLK
jgi:hypothetical protein